MTRPLQKTATALLLTFGLNACAVGPNYKEPVLDGAGFSEVITSDGQRIVYGEVVDNSWWESFGDPNLTRLVAEARDANPDILQAVARLDQAKAQALAARVRFLPTLNADGSGRRVNGSTVAGGFGVPPIPQIPEEQDIYTAELGASWEIDLFGRIRRRSEAAVASLEGVEWQRRDVLLAVTARVGLQYATLVALNEQVAVAEANIDAASESVNLTQKLHDAELASEELVLLARSDLRSAEAALPPLRATRHAAAAQLAILLGRKPGAAIQELIAQAQGPLTLTDIPTGLPSDLLRRRPDVRLAERQLASATAGIGAEMADLFPSFELRGAVGTAALSTDLLFTGAAETWSYGGFVRVPIFDLARQKADVDRAEALAAEALAAFDAAILRALAETEEALTNFGAAASRLASLEASVSDQTRAVELVDLRFSQGLASGIDVLDARRRLFSLRSQAAAAQGEAFRAVVNAHLALGGGWQTRPPGQKPQRTAAMADQAATGVQ
ncbi:MAG: efflux transporter outer membrane subunit [Parvularcula sp.]|jgi:NodT family efflux transporter outer membrane factor (OMF) lipoprotein|nr:efflux transporter outer membrane subunit [Parvularcula sp.]